MISPPFPRGHAARTSRCPPRSGTRRALTPIVGIGAGGHAKSAIDAIESVFRFRVVALLDADPAVPAPPCSAARSSAATASRPSGPRGSSTPSSASAAPATPRPGGPARRCCATRASACRDRAPHGHRRPVGAARRGRPGDGRRDRRRRRPARARRAGERGRHHRPRRAGRRVRARRLGRARRRRRDDRGRRPRRHRGGDPAGTGDRRGGGRGRRRRRARGRPARRRAWRASRRARSASAGGRGERGDRRPPAPLAGAAARRRSTAARARRSSAACGDGWVLRIEGEPEWPVDPADHDPVRRAALVREDGLDEAIVALSSPLGIEALPARRGRGADRRLPRRHVRACPQALRAWASAGVAAPDPRALGAALDEGFVGLVPARGRPVGPARDRPCAPSQVARGARGARSSCTQARPRGRRLPRAPGCPRGGRRSTVVRRPQMQAAWLRGPRLGAARAPAPAHLLRRCSPASRRCRPSAWPPAARRRPATTRSRSTTPRPTARGDRRDGRRGRRRALVHGSDRPVVRRLAPGAASTRPASSTTARLLASRGGPRMTDPLSRRRASRDLVDALAAAPRRAGRSRACATTPDQRVFELLWRDERVEVWLICWSGEDHDTGFHDHDISSGAFAVVSGELVEERLTIGRTIRRRLRRGQSLSPSRPPTSTACTASATCPPSRSTPTRPRCRAWASTPWRPMAPMAPCAARASRRRTSSRRPTAPPERTARTPALRTAHQEGGPCAASSTHVESGSFGEVS